MKKAKCIKSCFGIPVGAIVRVHKDGIMYESNDYAVAISFAYFRKKHIKFYTHFKYMTKTPKIHYIKIMMVD